MTPSDWIAAITALATAAGVFVVYFQLRKLSQQINLQHFSDYTKRYQSIIFHFREDINEGEFKLAGRTDYRKTMRHMRAYFDLSYEERYLNKKKLIDPDIWTVWRGGITTALSKPAFQQAWQTIKADTKFGEEFENFVDQCMNYPSRRFDN